MRHLQITRLIFCIIFFTAGTLFMLNVRNYDGTWKIITFSFGLLFLTLSLIASYLFSREIHRGYPLFRKGTHKKFSYIHTSPVPLGKPGAGKGFHPFERDGFVFVEGPIDKDLSVIRVYQKTTDVLLFENKVEYSLEDIKSMENPEFQKFIQKIGII